MHQKTQTLIFMKLKTFVKELIGNRKRDGLFDVLSYDSNICNPQGIPQFYRLLQYGKGNRQVCRKRNDHTNVK